MRRIVAGGLGLLVLAGVALCPETSGLTVLQMGLDDLCRNGHRIFRGTVLGSVDGTIELGGATVPVVTYRIAVTESFKGPVLRASKEGRVIQIRTLGKQAHVEASGLVHAPLPIEVPALEVGATYVLFTTRPGPTGLSTTVGLGQGCFRVDGGAGKETVANLLGNAGLVLRSGAESLSAEGPVPYDALARAIRDTLASQGVTP